MEAAKREINEEFKRKADDFREKVEQDFKLENDKVFQELKVGFIYSHC